MNPIQFIEDHIPAVAKLCRQALEKDIMPDFLLAEKTVLDPDFDSKLTYIVKSFQGDVIAFIMGVVRDRGTEKIGYIKLFCVHENFRRKGIGRILYNLIESEFKGRGIKKVRLFESWPNYYQPGIDPFYTEAVCFFERMKFVRNGDTSNLTADLSASDFGTTSEEMELQNHQIEIKRASDYDFEDTMTYIDKFFPAWKGEVSAAFKNSPVSLHIAKLDGEIRAFSAHEVNNIGTGWFGPMGTDPVFRGKGVGGILLKRCLKDMKEAGFAKATIPWVGPIPFYMHYCNSKVSRVFWRYEKILE